MGPGRGEGKAKEHGIFQLNPGDAFRLPGKGSLDGRVIDGQGVFDESILTAKPDPRKKPRKWK
jgi:cation transport ATPase